MKNVSDIVRLLKAGFVDTVGERVADQAKRLLKIETGPIRTAKVFRISRLLAAKEVRRLAEEGIRDTVLHDIDYEGLPALPGFKSGILVARRPGVTDDEGLSLQRVMADVLDLAFSGTQEVFTQDYFYITNDLSKQQLKLIAGELLANSLVHHVEVGPCPAVLSYLPEVHLSAEQSAETIDLDLDGGDDYLESVSRSRLLALNLSEMHAIRNHFRRQNIVKTRIAAGFPASPTDAELEIIGQTWSEHCKHKEFAAEILFRDHDSGKTTTIDSLFKTFIRGATDLIRSEHGKSGTKWLVKVFDDNAGIVRIDERRLFVWKVETHNSPSALDPYGGALTGIVGVNRDPLGTGRGGARLLFNTDVLCFGPPDFSDELLPGQLHPRRVMNGVCHGIEDGGNKSGIPTVNGAVVFDERFGAKPLVFCGTAGILPDTWHGKDSTEKEIDPGDLIVMAGGRVGKDGIHGATFSSIELDEHSPATAVQIGSPIAQKFLSDFLEDALSKGLIKCCTDNGAGGLSSSVGELANISGGAHIDLAAVPLKYPGLKPWEIFVSESQERMTLVVDPDCFAKLQILARFYETEVACIGRFTADGQLTVRMKNLPVALLDLDFLHDGLPRKHLEADWKSPKFSAIDISDDLDCGKTLRRLLHRWNVCSREKIIRRYDHEVKGRTVVKPLMGPRGIAPQDAAVVRFDFSDFAGVAVSNGICPRYGDLDPYEMSAGAFDEAVRQIVAVGGRLPTRGSPNNRFWSVNDNFCVPDSVFDPITNPDGRIKLGKLVRMCQALYDMSVFHGIPMTSGKDSMKNDFRRGAVKISVPPTVLYSMTARIDDVRKVTTAEFKKPGDLILVIGATHEELGGSELAAEFGISGGAVPRVRRERSRKRYEIMGDLQDQGLIVSCHDLSDGGLGVGLAESAFGGWLGADLNLPGAVFATPVFLFSESHSRFLVSVSPNHLESVQVAFGADALLLGKVTKEPRVLIARGGHPVMDEPLVVLFDSWNRDLFGGALE